MHSNNNSQYNLYNLYNLEPQFKLFLVNLNKSSSTIKNYLSDYRHFTGWIMSNIKQTSTPAINDLADFIKLLTSETIKAYRKYLISINLPQKTINRRLSTVRIFCTFCLNQGWLTENPSANIGNISITSNLYQKEEAQVKKNIKEEFEQFSSELLSNENQNSTEIDHDVKDFIDFITKK